MRQDKDTVLIAAVLGMVISAASCSVVSVTVVNCSVISVSFVNCLVVSVTVVNCSVISVSFVNCSVVSVAVFNCSVVKGCALVIFISVSVVVFLVTFSVLTLMLSLSVIKVSVFGSTEILSSLLVLSDLMSTSVLTSMPAVRWNVYSVCSVLLVVSPVVEMMMALFNLVVLVSVIVISVNILVGSDGITANKSTT